MRIPSQKHHFSSRCDINKDENTHWQTLLRIIAPKTKVNQSNANNNSLSLISTDDDDNKDFPLFPQSLGLFVQRCRRRG